MKFSLAKFLTPKPVVPERHPKPFRCGRCAHHAFSRGGWNSGIMDNGAIGRSGWRCYQCGKMYWDTPTSEWFATLRENMLVCASHIPEEYFPYMSTELLQRRDNRIANDKATALIREKKRIQERLAELEEQEKNGEFKLVEAS